MAELLQCTKLLLQPIDALVIAIRELFERDALLAHVIASLVDDSFAASTDVPQDLQPSACKPITWSERRAVPFFVQQTRDFTHERVQRVAGIARCFTGLWGRGAMHGHPTIPRRHSTKQRLETEATHS